MIQSKDDIIRELEAAAKSFTDFCSAIPVEKFFRQPEQKWSVAQNIVHLVTSARMTRLPYRLPKFIVRLYTGKPNRVSRSYDELAAKYKLKLEQGGKASGRFVPKSVPAGQGKEIILRVFSRSMRKLTDSIRRNWTDEQLDQYLAPHPLLGKITLRELGYFTIYHTEHHRRIIAERLAEQI